LKPHAAFEQVPLDETISPNDAMFTGQPAHYFRVARSAMAGIRAARALQPPRKPQRILDFACGHGRVMRALRAYFPAAEIIGCDIDEDGIEFCRRTFGSRAVLGNTTFEDLPIDPEIDLIWVGSLLTHLPEEDTRRLMRFLLSRLSERGILVVSSHGRRVVENLRAGQPYGIAPEEAEALVRAYEASSYGYADYPWQPGYGISVIPPGWYFDWCRSHDARLVLYSERAWDNHHDIIAVART